MQETEQTINWELCLQLANDNQDLAQELLTMFVDELPSTSELLHKHFDSENFENLQSIAHKLHGGACYTGVPLLKEAAKTLEHALSNQKPFDDIAHHFEELIENIQLVIDAYQEGDFTR